jgi:hypothetical protein
VYPLDEYLDCLPKSFGYSLGKGKEIFPDFDYGKC